MDPYIIKLNAAISKFINTYNMIAKVPRGYGTDLKIYSADIHMLEVLGRHPDVRIVEIVEMTNLTKGTISKTIKRLEEKGLVVKYQLVNNKKDIYYKLTDLGWQAFRGHDQHHEERNKEIYDILLNSTDEQKAFLLDFLGSFTDTIEGYKDGK